MLTQLSSSQARVIGVLMEKEVTTPDQYPLSLNALMLGCNQKSNRDPVMQMSENDVQDVLNELRDKNLTLEDSTSGRVVRYKHRFCNTEFSSLKFTQQQSAIICVLLLRGPQTPGELRTRTNRLAEFENVQELEGVLNSLSDFNGEEIVVKLAREPGKRESRYAHLFSGNPVNTTAVQKNGERDVELPSQYAAQTDGVDGHPYDTRITSLEQELASLKQEVAELKRIIQSLK